MKQIGILFCSSMVEAEIQGIKTNTRREVISRTPEMTAALINMNIGLNVDEHKASLIRYHCPYGSPGDVLYVRENYFQFGKWKYEGLTLKTKKLKQVFVPDDDDIFFKDEINVKDETFKLDIVKERRSIPGWYKRLGRFMPKKYARVWLQVQSISIERLQDISENDAISEGAPDTIPGKDMELLQGLGDWKIPSPFRPHQFGFLWLWCKINGCESWLRNPWVWVVKFKVLSTTGMPKNI